MTASPGDATAGATAIALMGGVVRLMRSQVVRAGRLLDAGATVEAREVLAELDVTLLEVIGEAERAGQAAGGVRGPAAQ